MDRERWQRIEAILERADGVPESQRMALIERECAGDAALLDEVLQVLAEATRSDSFLQPPAIEVEELPRIGERVGDYEFLEEIGRGGTSVVYRARQVSLEREVAIKILYYDPQVTLGDGSEVVREARLIARLRHPGIVPVHSVEQRAKAFWLIMDHIPGHDLSREIRLLQDRDQLDGGKTIVLPPFESGGYISKAVELMVDATAAIQHAHEKRIVHRDIKPHNLLLSADGRPMWVDFGLARDARFGVAVPERQGGTPYYMSPEQARRTDGQSIDHRTDIYSLGVVLYELLTLRRPFRGANALEIIENLQRKEPLAVRAVNRRVPRDLEMVCMKAMAKDPADRYAAAGEFAGDLRRFLDHEAVIARPPSLALSLLRFARRRLRIAVLLAALLTAVGLGAWIGEIQFAKRHWPRVTITLMAEAGAPAPAGAVGVRSVDPFTGLPGLKEPLGKTPLEGICVRPGLQRFVVEYSPGRFVELTRLLNPDEEYVLLAAAPPEDRLRVDMARIQGGRFSPPMPEDEHCPNAGRAVEIGSFWIDRYEVSNAEYREFCEKTRRALPTRWVEMPWRAEWDPLPVIGITWGDAQSYAEWKGKRLPTHSEWELASRGFSGRQYPWGDAGPMRGNTLKPAPNWRGFRESFEEYLSSAVAVRSSMGDETPEGVCHLMGNVREFTESLVVDDPQSNPQSKQRDRYVMGGTWGAQSSGDTITTHAFTGISDADRANCIGFRCARSDLP